MKAVKASKGSERRLMKEKNQWTETSKGDGKQTWNSELLCDLSLPPFPPSRLQDARDENETSAFIRQHWRRL